MSDLLTIEFEGGIVHLPDVVPLPGPWGTVHEARSRNRDRGQHWFSPGAMEFFNTKLESDTIMGRFFITSETMEDGVTERRYTVRAADNSGWIHTIGPFCKLGTYLEAQELIDRLLETLEKEGAL